MWMTESLSDCGRETWRQEQQYFSKDIMESDLLRCRSVL